MKPQLTVKIIIKGKEETFQLFCDDSELSHFLVLLRNWLDQQEIKDFDELIVFDEAKKPIYKLTNKFLEAPLSISVVGTGYVGLVSGVGLCHRGRKVVCVDIDQAKVDMINKRQPPIFEKGLKDMLESLPDQFFEATTDLKKAVMETDATFIAVGTPSMENGEQDLSAIKIVSKSLGEILKEKKGHLVVVKSTVEPGTTERIVKQIIKESAGHSDFEIAMVPEFLREGLAVEDFLYPFRIVIGVEKESVFEKIKFIHKEFETVFYKTTLSGAEMIKYASNALLATKITFANEIGNICKELNIDVYDVMDGVGLDKRINRSFLNAGRGYGGSCFPKDVQALIHLGKKVNNPAIMLEAGWEVNKQQPARLVKLAEKRVGLLHNKKVAVMGMAFKPGTDDIRESPAIVVINELLKKGAQIFAYDPVATGNMKKLFPGVTYGKTPEEIIKEADVVIGVTDWPDLKNEELYKGKVFIDGLKFMNKRSGKDYEGICW